MMFFHKFIQTIQEVAREKIYLCLIIHITDKNGDQETLLYISEINASEYPESVSLKNIAQREATRYIDEPEEEVTLLYYQKLDPNDPRHAILVAMYYLNDKLDERSFEPQEGHQNMTNEAHFLLRLCTENPETVSADPLLQAVIQHLRP